MICLFFVRLKLLNLHKINLFESKFNPYSPHFENTHTHILQLMIGLFNWVAATVHCPLLKRFNFAIRSSTFELNLMHIFIVCQLFLSLIVSLSLLCRLKCPKLGLLFFYWTCVISVPLSVLSLITLFIEKIFKFWNCHQSLVFFGFLKLFVDSCILICFLYFLL